MPSLRHWILVSLLPSAVVCLSCYVCATGGLTEFGECKEQFQYDCTPYSSKFPGERTYCRTTREKDANGSYSVMKECISETDHYSRFPEKGYPLEEECDLVDIKGQEVAYCVCRQSQCNLHTVADQFMSFEEKHPELFGEVEESDSKPTIPSGPAPLALPAEKKPSAAFAAPQIVPPAIVPVNDPRFGSSSGEAPAPEIRRQPAQQARPQLPTREGPPITTGVLSFSGISPVRQSGFVGTVGRDPSPSPAHLPSKPVAPLPAPIVAQGSQPRPVQTKPTLRCFQCGEQGLPDISSDCSKQTLLPCSQPDEICFTRMIAIAPGQNAVEKMCIPPESVRAMFGDGAVNGECGTASQGKEHYCTCTTSECNQKPLHDQRGLRSPVPQPVQAPAPKEVAEPEPQPKLPEPVEELPEVKTASVLHAPEPSPPKKEEKLLPIIPVVSPPKKKADLRCSFCREEGITDPTADCQASATRDCRIGQSMCLTQQTQLEADFRMEKRCVSIEEFANIIDGEPFEEGCATADDGMVNYCLCKGDKCNSGSLLNQAQFSGVRDVLESARHEVPRPKENSVQEEELPRVPSREQPSLPIIASGAPTHTEQINTKPMKSAEDEELELRRQQWAEADLSSSSCLSLLVPVIIALLL